MGIAADAIPQTTSRSYCATRWYRASALSRETDPLWLCAQPQDSLDWLIKNAAAIIQIVSGEVETAIGVATAPTGVGVVVALHGIDTTIAGIRALMGDGDGRTVTADMIAGAAFLLGTDKETAKTIGSVVAFLLGVAARRVR